jgi:hypothetical protein
MRSSRILTVTFAVSLFLVASPNVFARICHPKKPITCTAITMSVPAATVAPAAKAVKTAKPQAKTQTMVCGPWLSTFPYCAAKTLG